MTLDAIHIFARQLRRDVLQMTHDAKSSHVGTCLSAADILAVLYGGGILRVDPSRPDDPERDRFIMSKGHGAAILYAALARAGFFPAAWLREYCTDGGKLLGHVTRNDVPGVEVSTGSLGHGLAIGNGMALAAKRSARPWRVMALLGDGECDEGSVWEAALFAGHHRLDNLVAIIDRNRLQGLGRCEQVLELEPLADKWRAFGWSVVELDGHDCGALHETLSRVPRSSGQPTMVIAKTTKGKGVSFMEDSLAWHYRSPDDELLKKALAELEEKT